MLTLASSWSDLYYIPRAYFEDYIYLASQFYKRKVFHEIALPTIVNIIDLTRQSHPSKSIIRRWGDCFGDCCTDASDPVEHVLWNRCGHRLDYRKPELAKAHMRRLDMEMTYIKESHSAPAITQISRRDFLWHVVTQ